MKVISVVGARPNFMKIAPFIRAVEAHNRQAQNRIAHLLVHTGQHYDDSMSRDFFDALDIPRADIDLGIGSGTHAEQVGLTMIAFEKVLRREKADWVVWSAMSTPPAPAPSRPRKSMCASPTSKRGCARATCTCPKRSTAW